MFNWFGKKPTATIDFNQAQRDLYGSRKGSQPLVEDTDALVARLEQAAAKKVATMRKAAEAQVTDPLLTAGARQKAVEQVFDNMWDQERAVDAMFSHGEQLQQNHAELLNSLELLTAEVRRGATMANLSDFAKAHPFLTGFLATHLYHKVTSK